MLAQKNSLLVWSLIAVMLFLRVIVLFAYPTLYWDEPVYLAMGKAIFTGGEIGYIEWIRPPVLPLLLGSLWVVGLEAFIITKVLIVLSSLVSLILLVSILQNENKSSPTIKYLAAITLLGTNGMFLYYNTKVLGETLIVLFALASILSIQKNRFYIAGIFLGLAGLTKFNALILMICFAIWMIMKFTQSKKRTEEVKQILLASLGFLTLFLPYFVLNIIFFQNPFHSIIEASSVLSSIATCETYGLTYFITVAATQIPLFFLVLLEVIKKKSTYEYKTRSLILISALLPLAAFGFLSCHSNRYLLVATPYLILVVMFSWQSFFQLLNKMKLLQENKQELWWFLFILIVLLWNISFTLEAPDMTENDAMNWFRELPDEPLLSMSPYPALYSDKKIVPLYYEPITNEKQECDQQYLLINQCTTNFIRWEENCLEKNPITKDVEAGIISGYKGVRTLNWRGCDYVLYKKN